MKTGWHLLIRYADWLTFAYFLVLSYMLISPLDDLPIEVGNDKLAHVLAFALLAVLGTFRRIEVFAIVVTAFLFVVYGGVTELLQPYVNRDGEIGDFVANTIGVAVGTVAGQTLRRMLPSIQR